MCLGGLSAGRWRLASGATARLDPAAASYTRCVPSRVILFSTDSCTFCVHAKSLLAKRGVAFEEVMTGPRSSVHPV